MERIETGSIVISTAGRDKGVAYLVIAVTDKSVTIIDGKVRKAGKPKIKNVKHVKAADSEGLKTFADKINRGEPYSGDKLKKAIAERLKRA